MLLYVTNVLVFMLLVPIHTVSRLVPIHTVSRLVPIWTASTLVPLVCSDITLSSSSALVSCINLSRGTFSRRWYQWHISVGFTDIITSRSRDVALYCTYGAGLASYERWKEAKGIVCIITVWNISLKFKFFSLEEVAIEVALYFLKSKGPSFIGSILELIPSTSQF